MAPSAAEPLRTTTNTVKRGERTVKCLPCTWQAQKHGAKIRRTKRCSCLVGEISRPGVSSCSSKGLSMAQPSHNHQNPRHHQHQSRSTRKRWTHEKHGSSSKHYIRRECPAKSHCCTQPVLAFIKDERRSHLLSYHLKMPYACNPAHVGGSVTSPSCEQKWFEAKRQ